MFPANPGIPLFYSWQPIISFAPIVFDTHPPKLPELSSAGKFYRKGGG
jgi:hypothetical protein